MYLFNSFILFRILDFDAQRSAGENSSFIFYIKRERKRLNKDIVAVLHSNRIFNHVNKSASYIVISMRFLV